MVLTDDDAHLRQRLTHAATQVEAVLTALPSPKCSIPSTCEAWYTCPLNWLIEAVETDLKEAGPEVRDLATRSQSTRGRSNLSYPL